MIAAMPLDKEFFAVMEETARNLMRQSRALREKSQDLAKDAARIRAASGKARNQSSKKKKAGNVLGAANRTPKI
jgi:hypothetical protein